MHLHVCDVGGILASGHVFLADNHKHLLIGFGFFKSASQCRNRIPFGVNRADSHVDLTCHETFCIINRIDGVNYGILSGQMGNVEVCD